MIEKCPLCGHKVTYQGLDKIECATDPQCQNYVCDKEAVTQDEWPTRDQLAFGWDFQFLEQELISQAFYKDRNVDLIEKAEAYIKAADIPLTEGVRDFIKALVDAYVENI